MKSSIFKSVLPLLLLAIFLGGCAMNGPGPAGATVGAMDEKDGSMMRVAAAASESGDTATAIGLYRKLSAAHPDRVEPVLALGQALLTAGAADEALPAFQRAVVLQPGLIEAQLGAGHAYLLLRRLDQATNAFDTVLAKQPRNTRALNGKAVAADLAGHHERAQKLYLAGLDIAPDDKSLWNNLGLSLAFSRQYDDAVDILSRISTEPGATSRMRQNLALALGLSGKDAAAAQVSRVDLNEAAVTSNLQFYAIARSLDSPVNVTQPIADARKPNLP